MNEKIELELANLVSRNSFKIIVGVSKIDDNKEEVNKEVYAIDNVFLLVKEINNYYEKLYNKR